MYRIILASESPRRREIMETMGIAFETMASNICETVKETKPDEMVKAIASKKANHIADLLKADYRDLVIIGADTMVFCHGQAMGKPKNKDDAARMLKMLSDDTHEVKTGVCIIIRKAGSEDKSMSFTVSTKVTVQPLTQEQIEDYVATGEPMDKAGAYAIQGKFGIFINKIDGDYYNIVGFPIAKIYEKLLEQGIDIKKLN